jgi:hypothetical protein
VRCAPSSATKRDEEANEKLKKIKEEFPTRQASEAATAKAVQDLRTAMNHSKRAASRPTSIVWRALNSFIYFVAGVEKWTAARAASTSRVAVHIAVGLITLIVLVYVTLKAQYVSGSETFGADVGWDYAALLAAGFTATVTQGVAANLKAPTEPGGSP